MDKKSMLIYFDYEEIFSEFTDEELGELFRAVFIFCINGELKPKEQFSDRAVYQIYKKLINDQIRNIQKYEESCERQRRRKWFSLHKDATEEEYEAYKAKLVKGEPRLSTVTDNDNDIDNGNGNDNVNDNDNVIENENENGIEKDNEKVKEKDARENHKEKHLPNGSTKEEMFDYCISLGFNPNDLTMAEINSLKKSPNWKNDMENIVYEKLGYDPLPFN